MTAKNTKGSGKSALAISLALLMGIAFCCWLIWSDIQARAAIAAQEAATLDNLRRELNELKALYARPPCEIAPLIQKEDLTPKSESQKPVSANMATTPEDIEKACVFIVGVMGKNQISTGSGFFVAPNLVLTNKHVVQNSKGNLFVTSEALGKPIAGKIVAMGQGKNNDFALLQVAPPQNSGIKVLRFEPVAKKTEKISTWGFPNLVGKNDPKYIDLLKMGNLKSVPELSYTEGVISAILDRQPGIIVHTAPISPGNSGGPLLNQKGDVVGINTMIALDEDSYRQASIALASRDLLNFLTEKGIRAQVSD